MGTVLLVDDEPSVRGYVRRTLEYAGYAVIEAQDPRDALTMMDRDARIIDLVLTDVVMPGMSGRLMAERLAVRHPGVRVLFMSGNTELVRMVRLVEDTEDAILAKPFTSEQLIQRVGEMLAYRAKANAA